MAKTKSKKGGKGSSEFIVRSVRSKEDRKRPSVYVFLKTDQSFKGYALFEPDPDVSNNVGYYEYFDHYDQQAKTYVPCASDRCPFCAANLNPSTRALTVWYFPEAGEVKDQIKIFSMNWGTLNDTMDESEDEGGIQGKLVRIKRLSDGGDYKVKVMAGKKLTKADLKKAIKAFEAKLESMGVDSLEGLVNKNLKTQMERLKALEAMEDDSDYEDDDEDEKPKSRRGKAVVADEEEEDDDDDENDDDDDDDDDSTDEEEAADDEAEDDDDDDDEAEEVDDADDDDDDDEEEVDDEEEESEAIEGAVYEVVKIQERDEIFDLKNADGKIKAWLGQGIDVDYDEVKKGTSVKIDAAQDDEGDWIITSLELQKAKGGKKGKGKK